MNAIYLDFECLKTKPPAAILLGVLEDVPGEARFTQIILDPGLHPASAGARHLRRGDLQHAAEALVSRAEMNDCALIGWSLFDRDVLLSSGLPAALEQIVRRRYVNALQAARPWKTNTHPEVEIRRSGRFDARNRLDRFAELAGYGHSEALRNGTPALWIRRVQAAVRSAGNYRRMSAGAKEDWRSLLAYNRHDCRALRHVWLKACRELGVWRAYERTKYCVRLGSRKPLCFCVGSRSPRRDALLRRAGASRWAFITAWNPRSERLPDTENAHRQSQLVAALEQGGYTCLPGEGVDPDGAWPAEESLFVMGITVREARRVGRAFGQLAIVVGQRRGVGRLVRC